MDMHYAKYIYLTIIILTITIILLAVENYF